MAASDPDLLDILSAGHPAAFAVDSRERIVFWNAGAAEMLGRGAAEALGRHCFEVLGGRDVFGNRFCYANCPVTAGLRAGEIPRGFDLEVAANGHGPLLAHVTVLRIPSVRPDLFTVVHILEPVQESARLAQVLQRLGAQPVAGGCTGVGAENAPAADATAPLTARESEVLQWVAAGLQNKQIAQELDLSLATVRNHVHNMLDKLGVHSKLEAVSLAYRKGWVSKSQATEAR
jgi:DNA-binding CsgD family transcriptional regulator